jgi:hypothetical protein
VYYLLAGPGLAALLAHLRQVASAHLPEVGATSTSYPGSADTEDVGRGELLRRASGGQVAVLDIRPAEENLTGHIPGEISAPLAHLPVSSGAAA